MRASSAQSSATAKAAYLLKIAVSTIPRCGADSIAFLLLGFILLFNGLFLYREHRSAQCVPFETRAAVVTGSVSLDDVLAIDGVINASAVAFTDAELVGKDHSLSCELRAVQGTYLTAFGLEGQIFPDRSNMPVLVVNPAAGFECGEEVGLHAAQRELTAVVSGCLEDDTGEPAVYMSYETALALYPQLAGGEILLMLEGELGYERAIRELQRIGLYPEAERVPTDEDAVTLFSSAFALAGAFLLCAVSLLREKRRRERLHCRDEMIFLLSSGMISIKWVLFIRILAVTVMSAAVAGVVTVYLYAP